MCVKNASNAMLPWSPDASATFEIGTSTLSNFACWLFFSITRLLPFSRITRSSLGRLNAAVCTPRLASPAENTVLTTAIGASAPSLRIAVLRIDRQVVLDVLQRAGELLELRRFGLILDGNERFERGLVVEPLVFVDLVRPDRRLDGGIELHPLHVAVVVIVRRKRRGPGLEERLQRRLRRGGGGRAEMLRGNRQLALVFDVVGHERPTGRTRPGESS